MSDSVNCATDVVANPWLVEEPPTAVQIDDSAAVCAVGVIFERILQEKQDGNGTGSPGMPPAAGIEPGTPTGGTDPKSGSKDFAAFKDICSTLPTIWTEAFGSLPDGDDTGQPQLPVTMTDSSGSGGDGDRRPGTPVRH